MKKTIIALCLAMLFLAPAEAKKKPKQAATPAPTEKKEVNCEDAGGRAA